jgi:gliding motility-associated-like protein
MRSCLLTLAVLLSFNANSQIIGPDTVCVGTNALFTTPHEAISYTWVLDTVNIIQTPGAQSVVVSNSLLGSMTYMTLNNDNGHYYSFSTNYFQDKIIKLDYGTSPLNTPTLTDMGTFGLTSGQTDGIDVVKDDNGNWFAVVVSGAQMLRLSFGNSLANTPTSVIWNFPSNLLWPHQFILKEDGNTWMGFAANRSGPVSRFDFGTSLSNTPTAVNLPYAGGYANPANIALYNQNGAWHMLVVSLINNTLTRLDLGSNLQNNNPTGVLLGNPGGLFSLPRGTSILTDCDQQLISYTLNQTGELSMLDYQGNITNTPVASAITTYPSGQLYNSILPFTYNGVLYYLCPHTNNTIYRISALNYPPQTTTNYYDPNFSHTFGAPGIYNLTLHCDQGFPQGPAAYCKQVVVVSAVSAVNLGSDTTVCANSYTLTTNVQGSGTFLWSTGATTPTITVNSSGTYWVTVNGACNSGADTINIALQAPPVLDLGPDIFLCQGQSVTLHAQGSFSNPSYLWNTGATTSSTTAGQSGTYYVGVTDGPCSITDTVSVTIQPPPAVDLGPDRAVCENGSLVLQSSQTFINPTYTWSTGQSTPSITITQPGTYWLHVSVAVGCEGSDTVTITQTPAPVFTLNDTAICPGRQVSLQAQGSFVNPSYLWSTGSTASSISASAAQLYWLTVTENGCSTTDSMYLSHLPQPDVGISGTDSICPGATTTLTGNQVPGVNYLWSNGSTTPDVTVGPGAYSLTVTGSNGCSATDSFTVSLLAEPSISLPADTFLCRGDQLFIAPLNYQGQLTWNGGQSNSVLLITEAGSYVATVFNVCGSEADTINIDLVNCNIWLPDIFSPNGDGKNDIFRLVGDLSMVTELNFAIYNRWGERVFLTDDPYEGWDGMYKGEKQDLGTFGYMVKCNIGSRNVSLKGFMHLVR